MYSFEAYASKYDNSKLKVSAMAWFRGVAGSHDGVQNRELQAFGRIPTLFVITCPLCKHESTHVTIFLRTRFLSFITFLEGQRAQVIPKTRAGKLFTKGKIDTCLDMRQ